MRLLKASLLLSLLLPLPLAAATYVFPTDRFEIGRATAIVVGRVLSSRAEKTRFGIETATSVALEETIKGSFDSVVRLYEPGGSIDGEMRFVPGAPSFVDGERVLLLLYRRDDGTYTALDLELGVFRLVRDPRGRELAVRQESELEGWELDGSVHHEPLRSAEPFLNYVRQISRNDGMDKPGAEASYTTTSVPSGARSVQSRLPSPNATFTVSSYMLQYGSGLGTRWNVFPNAVHWNQGNAATGPRGNGTAQIKTAFDHWNVGGANYTLTSFNANNNGFNDASDNVNNFVFEKNLTSSGVQPFSCSSGGALGLGGMTRANFGAGAHQYKGETFGTTLEADVSMNQGMGACTTSQITPDQFQSVIVHELGHTLGFRHSDQTRPLTAPCSSDPTLDCSSGAIMTHILVSGLNGVLQTWDKAAVAAVYGAVNACVPPSITQQPASSAIASGSPTQLSVGASGTASLFYQWFIGASGDSSAPINGATSAAISVAPTVTTSYWVRVSGQCAPVANSNSATLTVNAACPAVVAGVPHADPVSNGYQLGVTATGGTSFTYAWFQGLTSGSGTPIGTGNPLVVSPLATTSYWVRITNSCGMKADSAVVRVTIVSCVAPRLTAQITDQSVGYGTSVTLTVLYDGDVSAISWFRGVSGDVSAPIGSGATITSAPLVESTKFWVRLSGPCGTVDSNTASVTVTRHRLRPVKR